MRQARRGLKEEVAQFACPSPPCPYYGKRPVEGGKLWVDQWMGKEKNIRLLRCGHCRQTFSERRGPALEEARLAAAEVEKSVAHLQEGCGIRRTARRTGHARSTVARYAVVAGAHARAVHDETRRGLRGAEVKAMRSGPLWGKKEAPCDANDKEQGLGDCWEHEIIEVASGAVIVRVHGPRTAETVHRALAELKERLAPGSVPGLVTTAEHAPYVEARLGVGGQSAPPERAPGGGAPKKAVLVPAPELVSAQVDKPRSASGRVETIEPRLVFGTAEQLEQRLEASAVSCHVNPAFSERANGTDRHRNPRKARKVRSFSKQGAEHRAVSWLGRVLGIFCWVPRTLRQTPAMVLGKAAHVLTIGEFLHLRPQGFRPPRLVDIRAAHPLFHTPAGSPEGVAQWPPKRLIQRSFKHLGVTARGLG